MLYVLYFGFWAIAFGFALTAWRWGGPAERWAAGMMTVAALATPAVGDLFNTHWRSPQPGVLLVDILLLFGLLVLALGSARFWPMTLASLQLLAVATHPALWIDPLILPFGYAFMQGFWSYPMMAVVLVGVWRHQRRAGERSRSEPS